MNAYKLAQELKPFDEYKRKIDSEWKKYDPDKLLGFSLPDMAADDWEINKIEDKPITAEEYNQNGINGGWSNDGLVQNTRVTAFRAGDKNGELRTELKYKDLVDELNMATKSTRTEERGIANYFLKFI